jgi:transcriptional regulator with XRE-family HTH domain
VLKLDPKNQLAPEHLKAFRKRYNLTIKEAADAIGVHVLTWGRWERGLHRIPVSLFLTLKPIADRLREIENLTKGEDR